MDSGWPSQMTTSKVEVLIYSIHATFAHIVLASLSSGESSATRSCGLGKTESQLIFSFFLHNPDGKADIVSESNPTYTYTPISNSSLNFLCHPLRP